MATVRRGIYKITDVGLIELAKNPSIINDEYLMQFTSFAEFKKPPKELQNIYQDPDNKNQVAVQMQNAIKGLFITTSSYTREALDSISKFNKANIVLIDWVMLCDLMIKYHLGVSIKQVYELKRIDEDYFMDE